MAEIIGYHVCKLDGGKDKVLKDAPFFSKGESINNNNSRKVPFLGKGFYFWEETESLKHSKNWGKKHCSNNFFVVKCKIETTTVGSILSGSLGGECKMLDLVGNLQHREYFRELLVNFKRRYNDGSVKIGQVIEHVKRDKNINFPFHIIRASDDSIYGDNGKRYYFALNLNEYSDLGDEKWIICLFNKKDVHLKSKSIVFSTENS